MGKTWFFEFSVIGTTIGYFTLVTSTLNI